MFRLEDNGENVSWDFGSIVHRQLSIDKGNLLDNSDSYLQICFENNHKLSTFYNYYGYVCAVTSFLTFRAELSFDEIILMADGSKRGMTETAKCYIKTEKAISTRSMMNVLPINLLTDDMFSNLVYSEMCTELNKKVIRLPISIIPQNDSDVFLISTDRIRNICSCLEVEMDAAGVKISKNEELTHLISEVKNLVKSHREGKIGAEPLPKKTYDTISNSIMHWGDSTADRAIAAWNNCQNELKPFVCMKRIKIDDKDIAGLIQTRNDITHRGFRDFSQKDAETAVAMMALIYCLALKRIGLSAELIKDLMTRKLIG
jgi:hypothetical protein